MSAVSRLAAGVAGLLTVTLIVPAVPPSWRWWVAGAGLACVLPGVVRRSFGLLEPLTYPLVIAGATAAAVSGRLSVPVAVSLGLVLLAYVVLVDLADELADGTALTSRGLAPTGVVGWLRNVLPLLAIGSVAAGVVGAVVLLPLPPLVVAVIAAPLALILAVALAFGRRFTPGLPGQVRDG